MSRRAPCLGGVFLLKLEDLFFNKNKMLKNKKTTMRKTRLSKNRNHFSVRQIRNANPANHRLSKPVRLFARLFSS